LESCCLLDSVKTPDQFSALVDDRISLVYRCVIPGSTSTKHVLSEHAHEINEARILIPQVDRNGLHVRALLVFATQLSVLGSTDEAVDFLGAAVAAINSLPAKSEQTSATMTSADLAWAEINDPRSLLDAPELDHAFSAIGVADLERATYEARKISVKSVQLVARLEAVRDVIRTEVRRPRSKPVVKSVNPSPK
jgi:hypothetical protein